MTKRRFAIARDRWRRGGDCMLPREGKANPNARGVGDTKLLNEHGHMCCLGQVALQLGAPRGALLDCGEPADVYDDVRPPLEDLLVELMVDESVGNTDLAVDCMSINDDHAIDDAERERRLIERAAQEKCELVFVDTEAEQQALLAQWEREKKRKAEEKEGDS